VTIDPTPAANASGAHRPDGTGHRAAAAHHSHHNPTNKKELAWLSLGALGVVYGDIGTSPLYALAECLSIAPDKEHAVSPADAAVSVAPLNEVTRRRLELLYAKDYEPSMDLSVLWRCWRRLGEV